MSLKPIAVVTGGAGFIGSHMIDVLLEKEFQVRIIFILSSFFFVEVYNLIFILLRFLLFFILLKSEEIYNKKCVKELIVEIMHALFKNW
jgi:UDP-glucose 4-epimerase